MASKPGSYAKQVAERGPEWRQRECDRKKCSIYGIQQWQLEELRQDMHCRICRKTLTQRTERVDHCHVTGRVRGLLCHKCNLSLGWYENNKKAVDEYV